MLDGEKRQILLTCSKLQHVRILSVRKLDEDEPPAHRVVETGNRNLKYPVNAALVELVLNTPNLENFA